MASFPIPNAQRFLVLVNPKASGGQPEVLRRRIAGAFAARRVPFDLLEAASASEALTAIREATRAGYRAIVAAGGDGTIALALRGTAGTEVPVAILPFGTGNQLALNFGIPLSLEGSVRVAVEGVVERIDLGRIGEEHFALIAGAGLDAEVMAGATSELKQRIGFLAYLYSGLKNVITPRSADYRIVADGQEFELRASMVLIANVGFLGAGTLPVELKVAPMTSVQDGLLDVCVFAPRHLPDFAGMLWKVARQKYAGDDRMIFLQAKKVRVESDPPVGAQIDGEARGETPVEAEIVPLAGRILVPS
ncbi:MAG: diacylglycerol/lipid kinase family protein [Gemmatimonadota bacterium]